MALLDIFKGKRKSQERIEAVKKKSEPVAKEQIKEKSRALSKASNFAKLVPHIAEKSTNLGEKGIYVFKVKDNANKISISRAIKEMYGVTPIKVNIINLPGLKKALVYLKKGDKIELS
ncbi:MAG: 50S ribosomal protein L23 [Parcubacteria group bacterium Athens0714_24]|nr:MAG: 50S ribosomal protein L23 [Parcubacteria group bacterium Athens0714_24]